MPSVSQAQHDHMVKACNSSEYSKATKTDQAVACEFVAADKAAGIWQKDESKKSKKKKGPKWTHW